MLLLLSGQLAHRLGLPVRSPSQVLFFNCGVGGWVCNNHPGGLSRTWGAIQEVAVVVVLLAHRLLFQVLGGIKLITTSGVQYNCVINRLKVPQHYNNFKLYLSAVWSCSWLVGCMFAVKSIIGTWWAVVVVVAAYLPQRNQPPTTPHRANTEICVSTERDKRERSNGIRPEPFLW